MSENYSQIEIDMSDENMLKLIDLWVNANLKTESIDTYEASDGDIKERLFQAILNEQIINVLTEMVESKEDE